MAHKQWDDLFFMLFDDLLIVLFEICRDHNDLDPFRSPTSIQLSHVCRRWRLLALSTPNLWARITSIWHPKTRKSTKTRCATWLKRSRGCFLSVAVIQSSHTQESAWHSISHLGLGFFLPYRHRITSLKISLYLEEHPELKQLQDGFTVLRYLSFDGGLGFNMPALFHADLLTQIMRISPNLDRLSLLHVKVLGDQIPYHQIRNLHVENGILELRHFRSLLESCTQLKECALLYYSAYTAKDGPAPGYDPITHPSLQTLRVECQKSTHSALEVLAAPNLRHLIYKNHDGGASSGQLTLKHINRFVQGARCRLTELSVDCCSMEDKDLISILELLPDLECLKLGFTIPDFWMTSRDPMAVASDLLGVYLADPSQLTKLSKLEVNMDQNQYLGMSDEVLESIVRTRMVEEHSETQRWKSFIFTPQVEQVQVEFRQVLQHLVPLLPRTSVLSGLHP